MQKINKNVLVTGAGKGIGEETVFSLLENGAYVYALIKSKKDNKKFKDYKNVKIYNGNVNNGNLIKKILKDSRKDKRFINGLVNNAGIRFRKNFLKITPKDLKNVFNDFSFPFYFIDFETVNQGVPIIKGTQPYYPLPFQWSVHKWKSIDKEIKLNDADSFIDFENQNIEREFIKRLLKSVGETGTIFAHSASTEKSVLKKLKDKDNCRDLAEKIEKLINRVADTLSLVKKHFYSPLMNGDYGIKKQSSDLSVTRETFMNPPRRGNDKKAL